MLAGRVQESAECFQEVQTCGYHRLHAQMAVKFASIATIPTVATLLRYEYA